LYHDKPYKDRGIDWKMKVILVADIMTRDPVSASPDDSLLVCAKKMVGKKVGSVLLIKKKRLVGIITQKDLLWAMIKKPSSEMSKIKAIDISKKKIATIKPMATIEEALNKMKKTKFERLPVLQDGELVGVITTKDILSFKPEFYPEMEEFEQIRDEQEKLKRIKSSQNKRIFGEGICEECGNKEFLYKINGALICESCKNSL
jgi:CBS domain-containing protein